MNTRGEAVRVVVWSLAGVLTLYMVALSICAVFSIEPSEKVLNALKDVGLVAAGALTGLLARTSHTDATQDVNVVNPPSEPVPTAPQPKVGDTTAL